MFYILKLPASTIDRCFSFEPQLRARIETANKPGSRCCVLAHISSQNVPSVSPERHTPLLLANSKARLKDFVRRGGGGCRQCGRALGLPPFGESLLPRATSRGWQTGRVRTLMLCAVEADGSTASSHDYLLFETRSQDNALWVHVPVLYFKSIGSDLDWKFRTDGPTTGLAGRSLAWPRGKVLGGSSALNGLLYVRGIKQDFDAWAADNEGWSYQEVLPFFKSSEDAPYESPQRGRHGPMSVCDGSFVTDLAERWSTACREPKVHMLNAYASETHSRLRPRVAEVTTCAVCPVSATWRTWLPAPVLASPTSPTSKRRPGFVAPVPCRCTRSAISGATSTSAATQRCA